VSHSKIPSLQTPSLLSMLGLQSKYCWARYHGGVSSPVCTVTCGPHRDNIIITWKPGRRARGILVDLGAATELDDISGLRRSRTGTPVFMSIGVQSGRTPHKVPFSQNAHGFCRDKIHAQDSGGALPTAVNIACVRARERVIFDQSPEDVEKNPVLDFFACRPLPVRELRHSISIRREVAVTFKNRFVFFLCFSRVLGRVWFRLPAQRLVMGYGFYN
jgi:hypothetical protein